ncbi:hypothetical protein GUJ93_ZPchr0009g2347 [Zizania palustris]|uniref:Matrin-type domain-containing protein n=1 Tax=Zizania palustris TaxID=103762 RepID=A0A8J5V3F1_ZIZPA|nr:hypothetical protein GUJ93_ZPchr0009g2347 [Zizania palustris]
MDLASRYSSDGGAGAGGRFPDPPPHGTTKPVGNPKSPPSPWSCTVCQVRTTSERNLREHCGGQKHQANVAELERRANKAIADRKAKTTTAARFPPSPCAEQRAHTPRWSCNICQVSCTGEWDFDIHLKGRRHHANTQALLRQCEDIEGNARKTTTAAAWICRVCQARCTGESDLQSHLKGKKHQKQVMALQETAKPEKNKPGNNGKNTKQKQPSGWGCSTCQAKCNSESQFGDHCRGRKHKNTVQSLQKGGEDAKAASDLKSKSSAEHSEKMDEQTTLYFCEVCNVKCTSEKMLAGHLSGKKHSKNAAKQKPFVTFCDVCDLQCNSEKMLAHHRAGKKHRAKLNAKK